MKNKLVKYIKKNKVKLLFFSFFIFYFILGFLLTYNYGVTEKYDFIFEADIPRVVTDCSKIFGDHYRIAVHPLYIILVQPIILIIKGITSNDILAILIFQATISSLQVVVLYKSIYEINKNPKISYLVSIIFGLSSSCIIFSSVPELYNLAALGMQIIWYLVIKKFKNNIDNRRFIFLLTLMGIMSLGITITNYIVFLIACFILLISKKINIKKIIVINLTVIAAFFSLNYCQKLIWHDTPTILFNENLEGESGKSWVNYNINTSSFKNVISDDYYNSIIGSDIYADKITGKNSTLYFHKISNYNLIVITLFYIVIIIFVLSDFKKNIYLNLGIILSLLFNTCFHLIYGNITTFLYSEHFLYLIMLLLGINYKKYNKKVINNLIISILILVLISEIIFNFKMFSKILYLSSALFTNNYFSKFSIIYIILVLLILYLSIFIVVLILKKVLKYLKINKQYYNLIILITTLAYITMIFVAIEVARVNKYFFGISIDQYKIVENNTNVYN